MRSPFMPHCTGLLQPSTDSAPPDAEPVQASRPQLSPPSASAPRRPSPRHARPRSRRGTWSGTWSTSSTFTTTCASTPTTRQARPRLAPPACPDASTPVRASSLRVGLIHPTLPHLRPHRGSGIIRLGSRTQLPLHLEPRALALATPPGSLRPAGIPTLRSPNAPLGASTPPPVRCLPGRRNRPTPRRARAAAYPTSPPRPG